MTIRLMVLLASLAAASCREPKRDVILATTTSTRDSGLLDVLVPMFEKDTGYSVKTIAVGSGMAMAMARRGEADVLLVHSPSDEEAFMSEGFGKKRMAVMHNDFVIVGPASDPAGVGGKADAAAALAAIARTPFLFVSRGDESGTHKKELALWKKSGTTLVGTAMYAETGQGMGQTLTVASEKQAYALTDRGTYLAMSKGLDLRVLVEGDPDLVNAYHVIVPSKKKLPGVNARGGKAFAEFLVSPAGQDAIGKFGIEEYGTPLFHPDAAGG